MKEELLQAIEIIKEKTGLTQGEISEKAGYASNYLAEAISGGKVSKKLLNNIKRTFYNHFENVDNQALIIKDVRVTSIENHIQLIAGQRLMMSILAEIHGLLSKKMPTELLSTYQNMLKDYEKHVREELRR